MDNLIQKRPFIVGSDKYSKLERVPLSMGEFQESWLQKLLQNSPQLLPVAEIDAIYAPLICIGREVRTDAGFIDNIYISPKGYITIVETKLWRNPQARREVVGQIIDYAKELKQFSYERLDKVVRSFNKSYYGKDQGLFETMIEHQLLSDEDETLFADLVQKNLCNARFLLLIVGDGIREGVWQMTEFLNSTSNMHYSIGLVELEVYRLSNDEKLVVPNLLMKTNTVERGVFRFEQGAIVPVMNEESELGDYSFKSKRRISKEDFINQLINKNPLISFDNATRFFEDLCDLGFIITPYETEDLRVKYPLPGGKSYLNVIYLSTENKGRAYKVINSLEKDLLKYGYSAEIARVFYKDLESYQDDSLGSNSTISHDLMKMLNSVDDVVSIFEKIKNNF